MADPAPSQNRRQKRDISAVAAVEDFAGGPPAGLLTVDDDEADDDGALTGGDSRIHQRPAASGCGTPETRLAASSEEQSTRSAGISTEEADPYRGFAAIDERLRSVLHHPLGLPLACHLDDRSSDAAEEQRKHVKKRFGNTVDALGEGLEDEVELYGSKVCANTLLKSCLNPKSLDEGCKEQSVTARIHKGMEGIVRELGLVAGNQTTIHRHDVPEDTGASDLLVLKPDEDSGGKARDDCRKKKDGVAGRALLLTEVGMTHAEWWRKAHQSYLSIMGMLQNDKNNKKLTGPMLVAVLTVELSDGKLFQSGRLGVFLVTPRAKEKDFRLCLLTRTESGDLTGLSRAFGKVLRAACRLATLDADPTADYEYLGPSCCRVGKQVLRSYDNRLRVTARSPSVYQELELVRPVTTVFECQDPNFNELRSSDNAPNDKKEWLWQFWGRLLILEVPYYEGRHFAESPSELLSVVEWLIELHEAGYVHGDIRPFNVVFHEKESRLIDLDLGGKLSEGPTYPEGYVVSVDGISRLGKAGKQITKSDDWYALLSVIFKLHVFSPVSETPFSPEARSWLLEQNDITPHQITELRQFLKQRDLKIQPELDFLNLLKAYGHYPLRTKGAASTAGTGTPPKK